MSTRNAQVQTFARLVKIEQVGTNGSSVYQLSQGEEKKYDFTFFNVDGKSTTCSTFFSSVKG
jgi:uncharacterized protein YxeA